MREIKFRGRHIETGEWVYGYLIGTNVIVGEIVEWDSEYFNTEFWCKVDPETVGRYTGLKNKNGKEIYEGDIVRFLDAYMNSNEDGDWDETVSTGQIKWDDEQAQFYATERESIDNCDFWENIDEAEVIGNIYENTDLLPKAIDSTEQA